MLIHLLILWGNSGVTETHEKERGARKKKESQRAVGRPHPLCAVNTKAATPGEEGNGIHA